MNTIKIVDLLSFSKSHLSINCFWLESISKKFNVELVCESEHFRALEEMLGRKFYGKSLKRRRGWRLARELHFFLTMLENRGNVCFVMGATGAQLFTASILEKIFPTSAKKWIFVLHSEVEGVDTPQGIIKRIAGWAIKYTSFARNFKFIVLGEHILKNLVSVGIIRRNAVFIEHPAPNVFNKEMVSFGKPPYQVAVIGLLRNDTKDLCIAAEAAKNKELRMSFIGRKGRGFESQAGVAECTVNDHYSNQWMAEKLSDVDALFLCPRREMYKFTALGTVVDSLAYGKPVIWIKHDALKAYEDAPFSIYGESVDDLVIKMKSWEPPTKEGIEAWLKAWNDTATTKLYTLIDSVV
ncbi:hypothetical protein [Halomonas sp.]|uniref:hypothetical protein n=1 Tax=Halomonas sp. TaxID=1486246 RepID=UPI00257F4958|nr:hypothetical protein [Halomonas sp.]MCJ8286907.1 hypothetical protein [Halomonas sp.]NQY71622.1 hypothetical protein [Halomonas sp.]